MKTVNESAEVGVIVARFQVPKLHEEHKTLIQRVVDTHPRVLVVLGLAADACKCTYNNPLDYPTRKAMVEKDFPTAEVLYIKDVGNNDLWSKELDRIISSQIGPGQTVVLYGSRDSFIPHYKGKFSTEELVPNKYISGKEIRRNVGIKSKATEQFREGVIWAVENQWSSALPTVDVAILDSGEKKRLLLCRKPNETLLRFVGGFASPKSDSYEDDAAREVLEETHLQCNNFQYVGSAKIKDWRFESERNKIKTILYTCNYTGGVPEADDDVAELQWVGEGCPITWDMLDETRIVDEHKPLFRMLKEKVINPMLTMLNR